MATNYPNSLDNFTNPLPTDSLASSTVPHAQQHANLNDAVEAVQTILGLNPAGSHLTVKDRIISAEQQILDQAVLNGLTDVTINQVNNGDILRFNGSTWANYKDQDLVDGGNF